MNAALLLEMAADALGDRVAIGSQRNGMSFAQLLQSARNAAAWMASRPEATIGFVGLNSEAFPIALYASALAGKAFAPLNYRLREADLRRIVARTAPSLIIADNEEEWRIGEIEGVSVVTKTDFLDRIARAGGEADALPIVDADAIGVLLFTSGTTGEPKTAVLRHRHLASYVISTVDFMSAGEEEAALVSVPPYHIAGVSAVLTSTYLGRRVVQLDAFAPEDWLRIASEERVTHAMVVPTMLGRILDVIEREHCKLPDLRHLSYGGGRMPAVTIERALRLLPHVDFVNAYGLTETSSTIAVLSPEDHRAALAEPSAKARLASVGRPLPGIELEVRGPKGEKLGPNEHGEIHVRGEQVSGEYLTHKATDADGWYATKDAGWLDAEGYLFIDGRLDDVIVRGGENISPGEVEDVLREHPDVEDVAVLGLPDNEWGERVAAVIVSQAPHAPDDLRQWVRARLRSTKTPEDVFYMDALPYNETGKLLRRVLKQKLAASG